MKLNQARAQTEPDQDAGLEIESLYVLGDFQGRRIGSRLFEKALEEARRLGAGQVWLGVWEKNVKARGFWRKVGFVEFGTHPFRFGSVEHTDLMMRRPVRPVRCCEAG